MDDLPPHTTVIAKTVRVAERVAHLGHDDYRHIDGCRSSIEAAYDLGEIDAVEGRRFGSRTRSALLQST